MRRFDQRLLALPGPKSIAPTNNSSCSEVQVQGPLHEGLSHLHGTIFTGLRPSSSRSPGNVATVNTNKNTAMLATAATTVVADVRNRGTCDNRLTIRRDALEDAVLNGLKNSLLHPDLIREFVEGYSREFNRLRREQSMAQAVSRNELAKVERQIRSMIEAVKDGFYVPTMKDEMLALEARKAILTEETQDQVEEPVLLHPGLADVYRRKVETLTEALNEEGLRTEAAESLRSMIQTIRLIPEDGTLAIELVGELAGLLALTNEKNPRAGSSGVGQLTLVAGAGFEPAAFRL
jgi:site-specific DNA recombinase